MSRRSRPAVFGFNGKVAEGTTLCAHQCSPSPPLATLSLSLSLSLYSPSLFSHCCPSLLSLALYEDAQEKGQVEKVGEELRSFQEVFDGDKEFQMELTSPLIRGDQYLPLLQELFPELGVETDAAKDLITELVTTSSAGRLKKILDDYDRLAQFNRRQVKARVTSAQPLTSEQVERLRGVLQKQIEGDETLELEQEVDESLLGGLRVDMNDRSIDLSVSQRLGELDRALRAS